MSRVGFEPAITATKRPQTYALDHAATGIGYMTLTETNLIVTPFQHKYVFLKC
jgi:hypothetical protein